MTRAASVPRRRPSAYPGWEEIIPAHARNTKRYGNSAAVIGDHPRACGEHTVRHCPILPSWGSSPRMRGTRLASCDASCRGGIIPAHAGNTLPCCRTNLSCRDHPRACGEHISWSFHFSQPPGSSPRMRGTRNSNTDKSYLRGIIPAHAGNTGGRAGWTANPRDHPRACGEHRRPPSGRGGGRGSSPRMRGTLVEQGHRSDDAGIIPAHAGNTGATTSSAFI